MQGGLVRLELEMAALVAVGKEIVPDLILCDVRMPELMGTRCSELRQDSLTAAIPFIFLTAQTTEDVLRQGQLLGANGYLTKPFTTLNTGSDRYLRQ